MILGIPREIKRHEYRVSLVPAGVEELRQDGHTVLIETGAGVGSGITDEEYHQHSAEILENVDELFERSPTPPSRSSRES